MQEVWTHKAKCNLDLRWDLENFLNADLKSWFLLNADLGSQFLLNADLWLSIEIAFRPLNTEIYI